MLIQYQPFIRYIRKIGIIVCPALYIGACSKPDTMYQEVCKLIGKMKYEQAQLLLDDINPSELSEGNPSAALILCDVGSLLKEGKVKEAGKKMISKTEDGSTYIVNIRNDDPL